MLQSRIGAVLLLVCGGLMCLSAVNGQALAITCTPESPISPARCEPAHEVEPGQGTSQTFNCEIQNGECVPSSGSSCGSVEGYGSALPGECVYYIEESAQYECTKDAAVTVVVLHYYRTACQVYEGSCQCVYIQGTEPPQYVQICNCTSINI